MNRCATNNHLTLHRTVRFETGFISRGRLFDLFCAVLLLPLLLGVGIAVLILNAFLNPGPLFYRQHRIGRYGQPFLIYKFRTMRGQRKKAAFATQERHRIDRFGSFLRRHRLDELPQIINVVRGEMSIIGPRPEQPEFARIYVQTVPNYGLRTHLRPGITGLGQICVGYTDDIPGTRRKLAYDLCYLRQRGVKMDAYVVWRTLGTMWSGRGGI